jgi:hypothetical protein
MKALYEFLNERLQDRLVKELHFETDEKQAEKLKIELGKKFGGVTPKQHKEDGEYALRQFRKQIKYVDPKGNPIVGVFVPGTYHAATSRLGDGPHAKAQPKVKWTAKKYKQWIEDMASGGGAEHAHDMAQNAKSEPGLLDFVKKNNRGENPLDRIQWDIEAYA